MLNRLTLLYDNHIIARIKRFFMTCWKNPDKYENMEAYDQHGKCMFVGYNYYNKDDEETTKLIWAHRDFRDEFAEMLSEEDKED